MKIVRDFYRLGAHVFKLEDGREFGFDEKTERVLIFTDISATRWELDCLISEYLRSVELANTGE